MKKCNYVVFANALRMLSIAAIERAKSGHPGMPMGMAEIAAVLWHKHLRHNPQNPNFINRDRFILSNGHGSMLLYSLLHLTGYNLTIDDLKNFRQLKSKTPGHPEYGYTDGVETTTGPLGQGIANAVGMALAEKVLSHQFNRDNFKIVDHHTYTFVGDGCLMEGISHEVCSLAGTMSLNKLIVLYDDNNISIDGEVEGWFTEDVKGRFLSYNWNVIGPIDGHDVDLIDQALTKARESSDKPTLIICKTIIGKGSPNKAGREDCHGSPLGASEIALVRENLNWQYADFEIPSEMYQEFNCSKLGADIQSNWERLFAEYRRLYPELASEFIRRINHQLPEDFDSIIKMAVESAKSKKETIATRKASQNAIEFYAKYLPEFLGGSADLTGSNLTKWSKAITSSKDNDFSGNYISYGVREFGMSAIMNGLYLHGGLRPFGGTFLMFSEYARNALRMASLMKIAPIFVYTHDSIGLGEDGPTHQAVEQLATLRLIPNMHVWRPCDTVETMVAWGISIREVTTPSALVFSRQNLDFIERSEIAIANISRGGYILQSNSDKPEITLIATGSEVKLALNVYDKMVDKGYKIQVVSMPSTSLFDRQDIEYKKLVLPSDSCKVSIEAGVTDLWYKYIGNTGLAIGIDKFGESANAADLFDYFGLTVDKIVSKIIDFILK